MKRITKLHKNQIFVFGSNLAGRHGKGAAKQAVSQFGAIYGQGEGLQGHSYGIPTKAENMAILSQEEIKQHVNKFLEFADKHRELEFLVTEVGCGLAGYKPFQIAPMFALHTPNVKIPQSFSQYL